MQLNMIIYVDIDDTICYRTDKKLDYGTAKPYPKRIQYINTYYNQGHTVIYWTARGTKTDINWFKITLDQLNKWGCKFHELRMNKPVYDLFIDDKNRDSDTFFD